MNLVTYAAPISLQPRCYALGLYLRTLSYENFKRERQGVLQVADDWQQIILLCWLSLCMLSRICSSNTSCWEEVCITALLSVDLITWKSGRRAAYPNDLILVQGIVHYGSDLQPFECSGWAAYSNDFVLAQGIVHYGSDLQPFQYSGRADLSRDVTLVHLDHCALSAQTSPWLTSIGDD
jgi:hypothetical protein